MAEFTVKYTAREGHELKLERDGDAGYDLRTTKQITVPFNTTLVVDTSIELRLPDGLYAEIVSRSGIAARNDIAVLNAPGIIDTGYEGNLKVILHNFGTRDFTFKEDDRIAQLVFHRRLDVDVAKVDSFDEDSEGDQQAEGNDERGGESGARVYSDSPEAEAVDPAEAEPVEPRPTARRSRGRGGLGSTGNA